MDVNSEGTNRGDKPRDVLSDGACSHPHKLVPGPRCRGGQTQTDGGRGRESRPEPRPQHHRISHLGVSRGSAPICEAITCCDISGLC